MFWVCDHLCYKEGCFIFFVGVGVPVFQGSFECVFHQQSALTEVVVICLCYKDVLGVCFPVLKGSFGCVFTCVKRRFVFVFYQQSAFIRPWSPACRARPPSSWLPSITTGTSLAGNPSWNPGGQAQFSPLSQALTHFAFGLMSLLHSFSSLFLFSSPWHQRCFIYQDSAVLFTAC